MQITVLRTLGPLLAKQWLADGTIQDYDSAKRYTVRTRNVENIHDLHKLLATISKDPRRCIIRGQPRQAIGEDEIVTRTLLNFEGAPSNLFMLDIDGFQSILHDKPWEHPEDVAREYISMLPPQFHNITCILQISGSCGHPTRTGLRAHLWFWLKTPASSAAAEYYCAKSLPGLTDRTVQRAVQVNYTADPVMGEGVTDPVGERLFLIPGFDDDFLNLDLPEPQGLDVPTTRRKDLVDPRDKPGVIGAFCRAFGPEDLISLKPDHFEAGSTQRRITWLHGGGSTEGVCITDSGTHLYNSHSTTPMDHAANLWDFIRVHCYGDLDQDIDEDAKSLDPTALPSHAAMRAWALTLPEVQEELTSDDAVAASEARTEAKIEVAISERDSQLKAMANLASGIAKTETVYDLENILAPRVSKANLTEAQVEEVAALMVARTKQLNASGKGTPINTVRKWLRNAAPGPGVVTFPHVDENGRPKSTWENVQAVCAAEGVEVQYNLIKKSLTFTHPGSDSYSTDNSSEASLHWMHSKCEEHNLSIPLSIFGGRLRLIGEENKVNPVRDWIESAAWDGVDRIAALADSLICEPGAIDPEMKMLILRKWVMQAAFAACTDRKDTSYRGILVLQGPQNIGKSRWGLSIAPGLKDYVMMGHNLDANNKDSRKLAISHWITELGELDGTMTKSDLNTFKAFIADLEDKIRLPYAATESHFRRRTVFYASVNSDTFLTDPSGNTRFWVIPVIGINCDHGVDMQQLWAQAWALSQTGEPYYLDQEQTKSVESVADDFVQDDPVRDKLRRGFPWEQARRDPGSVQWVVMSATQIMEKLGYTTNITKGSLVWLGRWARELNPGNHGVKRGGRIMVPLPLNGIEDGFDGDPLYHSDTSVPARRLQ